MHTRRALWSTWRTVAPVGAWVSSVVQADTVDYGAGAPETAEELPFTILIPELWEGFSGEEVNLVRRRGPVIAFAGS